MSVKRSEEGKKNSGIWRVIATNFYEINDSSWKKFHVLNAVSEDILSMAIANNYIYAGRSDGIMWRCSANESNSCRNLNQFEGPITNVDYHPKDDKIFAFVES